MNQVYDVIIIGCGEAGIYAGYELSLKNPSLKIGVFEQGRDIYKRSCPIVAKKVKQCINCKVCDTMCGFGGAGAFSDGKFNFTTEFGGWLTDYMDHDEVMELIHYVDDVNVAHGATTSYFSTTTPEAQALAKKALEFDLHLLQAQCKHLGTEKNLMILTNIYEDLKRMFPAQWQVVEKARLKRQERLERLIEEGVAAGELRPIHIGIVSQLLRGAFDSFTSYSFLDKNALTYKEAMRELVDILLQGLERKS